MTRAHRDGGLAFEHKSEALLSPKAFLRRMLNMGLLAIGMVVIGLLLGAVGYHTTEGWSWLDSTFNAAMILTGMGPADPVRSTAGKLFAIGYSLFSGVVFLSIIALVLAPIAHRILHSLHLEVDVPTVAPPTRKNRRE